MDLELAGRVAVVTGGASGIGRACVARLAEEGAMVVILDRDPVGQQIADRESAAGRDVSFIHCDVTVEQDVQVAAGRIIGNHGRIDGLVCSAGISGPVGAKVTQVSVAEWDRVMSVNVRGNFLVVKHSMAGLTESDAASVMFVASDAALVAFAGMAPYCSSKAALVMLAKSLSVDFPTVRFNCLCPGVVDTPMSRADLGCPDGFEGMALPVIDAEQLAKQAAFLVSPVSYPINATTLVSDFGYVARSALPDPEFVD